MTEDIMSLRTFVEKTPDADPGARRAQVTCVSTEMSMKCA